MAQPPPPPPARYQQPAGFRPRPPPAHPPLPQQGGFQGHNFNPLNPEGLDPNCPPYDHGRRPNSPGGFPRQPQPYDYEPTPGDYYTHYDRVDSTTYYEAPSPHEEALPPKEESRLRNCCRKVTRCCTFPKTVFFAGAALLLVGGGLLLANKFKALPLSPAQMKTITGTTIAGGSLVVFSIMIGLPRISCTGTRNRAHSAAEVPDRRPRPRPQSPHWDE